MRGHRLKRKLLRACVVFALPLIYVASTVLRLRVLARDLVMREARATGLSQ